MLFMHVLFQGIDNYYSPCHARLMTMISNESNFLEQVKQAMPSQI